MNGMLVNSPEHIFGSAKHSSFFCSIVLCVCIIVTVFLYWGEI